ncbi:MAG: DNA polymerase Y family protein [Chloroflexi bacterium]|nr:DNA polymerase Y family protein [Chloroflexota bacterium]MDA1239598.1 DNA polymerase Y family protein [Chloroflexota bacterium]
MSTLRPDLRSRSIACLAIPSLALQCELVDRPGLIGSPVALSDEVRSRVTEATREARHYGVRVGMTLRDAVALCPMLTILEPRPALVAKYADGLVQAMEAVSPFVEEAERGLVFADLRGTEGLYPRIEDLSRAIFVGIPPALRPQLGVAEYRFTAFIAALHAQPSEVVHVPVGDAAEFLADAPISRLALNTDAVEQLHLLGIERCGQLAALPRHAVEAQFGYPGGIAWLAARGQDTTPLRPRPWVRERVVEVVEAEPPLVSHEAILHALEQMLGRALRHPMARRRFVRLLRLRAEGERGGLWEREQVLREPQGDRDRLWRLIRTQVEYASFPGPLTRLSLELGALTAESGRQHNLFSEEQIRRREQLDEMVRHLKVRFGQSPVSRVVPVEPWHRLPEHRYALLEYDP